LIQVNSVAARPVSVQATCCLMGAMAWTDNHLSPGELAPASGRYQAHGVLGSPTDQYEVIDQGMPLPSLPRGFTWLREAELMGGPSAGW
jgi:hypothetical protein